MPFSFGSKVSLKSSSEGGRVSTYVGYTTIPSHEDLTDTEFPLYYVPKTDDFTGVPYQFTIDKGDIIDLYVIGQGGGGVYPYPGVDCNSIRCQASGDPPCCCTIARSDDEGTKCQGCQGETEYSCCGQGVYATGGYSIPYHIRIDTTNAPINNFPATLTVEDFTDSTFILYPQPACANIDPIGPAIRVTLKQNVTTLSSVSITDPYSGCGGYYSQRSVCANDSYPCLNGQVCPVCPIQDPGSANNSSVVVVNNVTKGLVIQTSAYGSPESDGTIENIFYTNFGWTGLSGVEWNNYGTGCSGATVTQAYLGGLENGCNIAYGCTGTDGRIMGIAINGTFEP